MGRGKSEGGYGRGNPEGGYGEGQIPVKVLKRNVVSSLNVTAYIIVAISYLNWGNSSPQQML